MVKDPDQEALKQGRNPKNSHHFLWEFFDHPRGGGGGTVQKPGQGSRDLMFLRRDGSHDLKFLLRNARIKVSSVGGGGGVRRSSGGFNIS